MLDQELAGKSLRELQPISLNLPFILFPLKLTRQWATVWSGGGEIECILQSETHSVGLLPLCLYIVAQPPLYHVYL